MKYCLLFLLFCILFFFNVSAQKSRSSFISNLKYVDVFHQHLKILDSVIKSGRYDNFNECDSSIKFMGRVTHIKPVPDLSTYMGWLPFTIFDLCLWKTWYKNIGSKRIGMIM